MSDRVLYICGVLCVAPCARVLWALYICGVVCVAPWGIDHGSSSLVYLLAVLSAA